METKLSKADICVSCGAYAAEGAHICPICIAKTKNGGMNMSIKDLVTEIHNNAVAHGWWESKRSFGEVIALCHSELSEALEEYRNGKENKYYENGKPEGIAVELADCVIRIFDYCGKVGIDIESVIQEKHIYNKTRPYRHGGKII